MAIGRELRAQRLAHGMTQEQLAERLGVTRQAVSSYESDRTRPDIDMLGRMAGVFGTDLDGLVSGQAAARRAAARLRIGSAALAAVLTALTLASSALLWCADRFYPLPDGGSADAETLAAHSRLTGAWAGVDSAILALSFAGLLALLVLTIAWKPLLPWKRVALRAAVSAAAVLLAAVPFALTDRVFTPVNYYFVPVRTALRIALTAAACLLADHLRRRARRRAAGSDRAQKNGPRGSER